MKKSSLLFTTELPRPADLGEELLLIHDEILPRKSKTFKKWMAQFPLRYPVKAGESLKSVQNFPEHITKIVKLCEGASSRRLTVVVAGGGSVGDFGGFVASILKRGVRLVHMPSTWLSAIDSAHGGKTALNVGSAKNQIGTFYPADKIVLSRSLLMAQPDVRAFEGFGELLKIALIAGGPLWRDLSKEYEVNAAILWKYLSSSIDAKYKVVAKDPEEKSGHRHILNLGHTLGHVLETQYELPHGVAINYGLEFALCFSLHKKIITPAEYEKLMLSPVMGYLLSPVRDELLQTKESVLREFRKQLLSDKKKTSSEVLRFVFLKKPGQCVVREVSVDDILVEVCRQKEDELNG
ncbi:3-dehydroquinate synthase family protein [Bdellovibrio bacteriovorus]|uniref:3-dehydroquinate synthase family protein n=1 Tax=Bdellovibrio bacteriovorus TaxID=959 RepID=UPI003CFE99CF